MSLVRYPLPGGSRRPTGPSSHIVTPPTAAGGGGGGGTVIPRSVTVTTNAGGASSATTSHTTPSGVTQAQVGDVVLFWHGNDFYALSNMPTPTVTGSPTITPIIDVDAGTNQAHIRTYWYVVNTGGPQTISVTETGTADEEKWVGAAVLAGADTSNPIDGTNSAFSAVSQTSQVAAGISPATNALMFVINGSGGGSSSTSYTEPGSMTEQFDSRWGGFESGVVATEQLSASGSTGTRTITAAATCTWAAATIGIKAASVVAAATTESPLVVGPPFSAVPVPGAKIFGPGALAAVVGSRPAVQPLVVSTPWKCTVPPVTISASQPLGNPSIASATLTDTFTVQDTAKWSGFSANAAVVSGRLSIDAIGSYPALLSVIRYNLVGSTFAVELAQTPNVSNGSTQAFIEANDGADGTRTDIIEFGWINGSLKSDMIVGGVSVGDQYVTYDAVQHRHIRIRVAGTTVYWEVSRDGRTWDRIRSATTSLALTSVRLRLVAGNFNTAPSPGSALFDNVNLSSYVPLAPVSVPAASVGYGVAVDGDPFAALSTWRSLINTFNADAGKSVGVASFYLAWSTGLSFPAAACNDIVANNEIPHIVWEPWDYTGTATQPAYQLADIIAGTYDAYITAWAQDAAAWGRPFYLRFAHEMNGNWYPWAEAVNGNVAGEYVTAWQHVHAIFVAQGATNAQWVWCPFVTGPTALAGLYPGDSYVDIVGLDGYNWGTTADGGWMSFRATFSAAITTVQGITSKPLWICEVGSAELTATQVGDGKAEWIADAFAEIDGRAEIKGLIWFNYNSTRDWRIESSAGATSAFAAGIADPRFGTQVGTPQPAVVSTPWSAKVPGAIITASQPLGNPAVRSPQPLVVSTAWTSRVPGAIITASRPLGNPAVGTESPLVVTPTPAVPPVPGAKILGPGAITAVAATAPGIQPLVVSTTWQSTVPPVTITESQPLGNPAVATESALVVTPIPAIPPVYPAQLSASEPLGNPAVGTGSPLVVTPPPFQPTPTPPVTITASQPLGNPAIGTGSALVVTPPTPTVPVPRVLVFGPGAPTAVVATTPGTQPLVVSTPWSAKIPGALITASQPLGNPATSSPQPLIVSTPWTSRVPGALLSANPAVPVISTVGTPGPLVVGPPFAWCPTPGAHLTVSYPLGTPAVPTATAAQVVTPPYVPVPIPPVTISASQPLGRPATGTPNALVVSPTFTLAPIPGAAVFAAPAAATVVATITGVAPLVVTSRPGPGPVPKAFIFAPVAVATTPNVQVIGPPFTPVPVPGAQLNSSLPLGRPAVGTRSAQVVGPPFAWTPVHITRLPLPQTPPSIFVGALDTTTAGSGADGTSYGSVTADQATAGAGVTDGIGYGGGELDGGASATGIVG